MNNDKYLQENVTLGHARGWAFAVLAGKVPVAKGWQKAPHPPLKSVLQWIGQGHNIGLRTGKASGIVVIDVDVAKGGVVPNGLPETVTVQTGGGGLHFYFAYDAKRPLGNAAKGLPSHIDMRGDGGQVVYPGSVHPDTGAVYAWAEGLSPEDIEVAPLPDHIYDLLMPKSKPVRPQRAHRLQARSISPARDNPVERCRKYLHKCPDAISGEHGHDSTFRWACECARFGLSEGEALDLMLELNVTKTGGDPWTEGELRHKVDGAYKEVGADFGMYLRDDPGRKESHPHQKPGETEYLSELAAAQKFALLNKGTLHHKSGVGWLAFDRKRWKACPKEAQERACALGQQYRDELAREIQKGVDIPKDEYHAYSGESDQLFRRKAIGCSDSK